MALKYDLDGIEILKILGFTEQNGKEALDKLEQELNTKLPKYLYDFLSLAIDNPLFGTADIWTEADRLLPYFSYETIEEYIEEMKEDWEECPEEYADDEVYQFAQMSKEQWHERVANYLKIGSDYGAGVAAFGILEEDLAKENPPVYMLIEEDSLTDWNPWKDTISDYVMCVLVDILACTEYNTAKRVLTGKGWDCCNYDFSEEKGIDLSLLHKYGSLYHDGEFYGCVYDDDREALIFIGGNDSKDMSFEIKTVLTSVEKFFIKKRKIVEKYNQDKIDALKWEFPDVLYSFRGVYAIGVFIIDICLLIM